MTDPSAKAALDRWLLDFVNAAEEVDVVDLGAHSLKGVKAPLRVFTPRRLWATTGGDAEPR